jgi:peptidoglycan/LPS O-acetylase OafA/YrhL
LEVETHRRADIQILRGISVLAVILFHLDPQRFPNGYLGVDAFFVVSGFVVAPMVLRIFEKSHFQNIWSNLILFYKTRYFRLAPALGATLGLSAFFIFLFGPIQDQRYFSAQGIAAIFLLSNVQAARLSGNNYFQPNPNPLLHTWSLSIEEQIYFIFPLFMLFAFVFFKKRIQFVPKVIFLTCYLIYFFVLRQGALPLIDLTPGQLYYSPIFRLWEFAIGAMLGFGTSRRIPKYYFYIAFPILIILIFSKLEIGIFSPEVVCILIAVLLASKYTSKQKNLFAQTLAWTGDRSYSIYLVHLPIIYINKHSQYVPQMNYQFFMMISIIQIFLAGQFLWRFIEFRFRIKSSEQSRITWTKSTLVFTIVPLILMSAVRIGSTNYYGLTNEPEIQGTISCLNQGRFGECISPVENSMGKYLLMGDSHAAALSQTFITVMNKHGIDAVVMSGRGCQTYGIAASDLGCGEYRTGALEYLQANPGTQVLVVQRSSSIQSIEPYDDYLQQIVIGLKEISKVASRVTVLGPNPEFPTGNSQGYILDLIKKQGEFPKNKMIRNSFQDNDFYQARLSSQGINYVSTSNAFCKKETCMYKLDNKLLYWDEDHLSLDGAKYLSPLLESLAKRD